MRGFLTKRFCALFAVAALCLPSTSLFAEEGHEHGHGDVLLTISPENELATGLVENQTEVDELEGVTIYEVELDDPGVFGYGEAFHASVPGVSSGPHLSGGIAPHSALTPNTDLTFELLHMEHDGVDSNLLFWDFSAYDPTTVDEDDVTFVPVSGSTLTISDLSDPLINAVADGSGSDVSGFTIGTTDSTGGLHEDMQIEIADASGIDTDPGIYLWSMEFDLGGIHSDPVYFLAMTVGIDMSGNVPFDDSNFNANDSEELEEAFENMMGAAEHYVAEEFGAGGGHDHGAAVPEPSTLAMTLMGLIGAFACVRRRRNLK
ncbi:MAG: PEP-CTERM sorting domain-containing protein [Planctomycetota bacterium]|nr:PEP-CTERM sorting domain-containing protein [Planctomycetota bacterium]